MGKGKLTIALMLVFVLAMSAGLMVLLQANTSSRLANEIHNSEFLVQRTAIDNYNQSSDEFNLLLDDIQNNADTRANDDVLLSDLLEKAHAYINNLNNIFTLVQNSTELSPEIIAFMDDLQAQFDAARVQGSSAGIQSRVTYTDNYYLTAHVLWWDVNVGYHFSPSKCKDMSDWAGQYGNLATLAALLSAEFPIGSIIAGVLAAILIIYSYTFYQGSLNKGCDWFFIDPLPSVKY